MKKAAALFLILAISAALLAGCGGSAGANKLADSFNEADVKKAAETAVATLDSGDYDALNALCADSVKQALSADVLAGAVAQVRPNAGVLKSFQSETVIGQKDASGNDCAVAVLKAEYENQTVTYTISLDTDLLLIGFYLK